MERSRTKPRVSGPPPAAKREPTRPDGHSCSSQIAHLDICVAEERTEALAPPAYARLMQAPPRRRHTDRELGDARLSKAAFRRGGRRLCAAGGFTRLRKRG
jgi:hypothetical protein